MIPVSGGGGADSSVCVSIQPGSEGTNYGYDSGGGALIPVRDSSLGSSRDQVLGPRLSGKGTSYGRAHAGWEGGKWKVGKEGVVLKRT